ncbi:MAG: DeoR/GlpR family DNA-binding transcription regulator [Planctomycetia bacterium]
MLVEERRQKLSDLVRRRGYVSLPDLAATTGVSESTVRRDLDVLHESGVLRRTRGGAMAMAMAMAAGAPVVAETSSFATGAGREPPPPLPAFEERAARQMAEKRLIGRRTAELVGDGETVLLDGGTTTLEVARCLVGRSLQVVTNSLPIANLLGSSQEIDLVMLGGFVYPKTGVALGSMTQAALECIHVNHLVMGVSGLNARGLFNGNMLLVETERAMMAAADCTTVVADHTKFGRQALSFLADWSAVHRLVADDGVSPEQWAMVGSAVETFRAGDAGSAVVGEATSSRTDFA